MKNQDQSLTFIDLFAGLGGFHIALEQLGCKCVFASELREDLKVLYKENHPETNVQGDITKVKVDEIPPHDILCAGFPCQPFSQAGKQQGFSDEKNRGNLFNDICRIVKHHRPKYIILENVSNLKGHDHGNTWRTINEKLTELEYEVPEPAILSPHQFGYPQHRKRIYIVAIDKHQGTLKNFSFPTPTKIQCDIKTIIDETDTNYLRIKKDTRYQLEVWQEFIDKTIKYNPHIPHFPIWAMEFGADYPINKAPAFMTPDQLIGKKGKLGRKISEGNLEDCLLQLPKYAQTKKSEFFPSWKISYIQQNRDFYIKNEFWLKDWLKKVSRFENSHLKFEWNCGDQVRPILFDKIIQFRASGIRVKKPDYSPALNLVGTQVPIFPWVQLPDVDKDSSAPKFGRYMTVKEAAKLQGMETLSFGTLSQTRCFEALGNAVNVDIVREIADKLIHNNE